MTLNRLTRPGSRGSHRYDDSTYGGMCRPGGLGPAQEPGQPWARRPAVLQGGLSRAVWPCAGEAELPHHPEGCALCPYVVPVGPEHLFASRGPAWRSRASLESQVNFRKRVSESLAHRGTPLSLEGAGVARGFDNDLAFCGRSPERVCWALALGRNLPCEQEVWWGEESMGFVLD